MLKVARCHLNQVAPEPGEQLSCFITLGRHRGTVSNEVLIRRAVLVYATYQAANVLRRLPPRDPEDAYQHLAHMVKEAVRDHSGSTSAVVCSFVRTQRPGAAVTSQVLEVALSQDDW